MAMTKEEKYAKSKAYYHNNKEKIKKQQAQYRKKNTMKTSERMAIYYANNKEKINEKGKKWARENRHLSRISEANYRKRNPGKIKKRNKEKWILDKQKLSDTYIKKVIKNISALKTKEIPMELIETYRIHLTLKRALNNDNKSN